MATPSRRAIRLLALVIVLCCSAAVAGRADDTHCTGCMDGMPMPNCPKPQDCGYAPILCVDCMAGMAMPKCPNATWCAGVDCSNSKAACMDGMPMDGCPDPGTCGFQPIACSGCVPGLQRDGCPDPTVCANNQTTPPCMDCMAGMSMPYCPNATFCALGTPIPWGPTKDPCATCMPNMVMPGCPPSCMASDACTMEMLFNADRDTCLLLSSWKVGNGAQWFGAFVAILVLAAIRELLSVWRSHRAYAIMQENRLRILFAKASSSSTPSSSHRGTSAADNSVQLRVSGRKPLLAAVHGGPAGAQNSTGEYAATRDALEEGHSGGVEPGSAADATASAGVWKLPPPEGAFAGQLFDSFYYALTLAVGYVLMLVIMTYNVYLCLMVVAACFLMHLLWNYLYRTHWQRKYQRAMADRIKRFQAAHADQDGGSGKAASNALAALATAGHGQASAEHCCPDPATYEDAI